MGNPAANPQQVQADDQSSGHLPRVPVIISEGTAGRTLEACERELIQYKAMERRLRDALGTRGPASSERRVGPSARAVEKGIRSSVVERPADDHQPAFVAEPGSN